MRRPRGVEISAFPATRRLIAGALRAGRRSAVMHGLIQVDVTDAMRLLHGTSPPLSFTAFVIACVARAAAAHPEVHAYRDWRGRLVRTKRVDVGTMIEMSTMDGPFPLAHLVRDADVRDVADITAEIRAVRRDQQRSRSGRWFLRYGPIATRIPGLMRLFYFLMSRSPRMRALSGTVAVTAVGMFGDGGGFGIPSPGILEPMVTIGGISTRPMMIGEQIQARRVLDLTITIDHSVVDGAPAARFAARLRQLIEHASADVFPASAQRST